MDLPAPYRYVTNDGGEGYLWLALEPAAFSALPEIVRVFDTELVRRPEFHITLGNLHDIMVRARGASSPENEQALLECFIAYVSKHSITLTRFLNDLRFAEKNERASIVVRCEVANLEDLYKAWEEVLGGPIGLQPTHVTIYSRKSGLGIGINTLPEMEALQKVTLPEVASALALAS